MSVIVLKIVGIRYSKDISGQIDQFLTEAVGRSMTIRPESSNDNDKVAVRAYDWIGRFVGYVSKNDLSTAWGALRCTESKKLRGMVVASCVEHPCITFECSVPDYTGPATDLYPQKPFLDWKYSGPELNMPDEFENLAYMCDEIKDRLDEREDWDEDDMQFFLTLSERFSRLSKYDISGQMSDYRCELIGKLKAAETEEFDSLIEELKMTASRTGRETMSGSVLEFWTNLIQSTQTRKHLMVHQREYDVDSVEKELEQFPESMYYEWKANSEHFVSKLYYMHIPRKVIWRLVSGIAFVEMTKAIAQKANAEKTEKQRRNVIMTGDNAKYIETA
ncbi:MAG: hypothetical protein IJ580_00420 [Prevotella sp.]|nr:hypothetical protein [Prevotella sp.]